MYNNIKTLQDIAKKISGLKITFDNRDCTCLWHNPKMTPYINLNLEELNDISISEKKQRKDNVKYFYLIVLLHEIGHYRKLCKFKSVYEYEKWKRKNYDYNEKIADRYAQKYYKKYAKK